MLRLVLGILTIGVGAAHAAPRAQLAVNRQATAQDCAGAEELAHRVSQIAGTRVVTTQGAAPVSIEVSVERSSQGYDAAITVSGAQRGTRQLTDDGPDCRALDEAVAVTLALLLDAGAAHDAEPHVRSTSVQAPAAVPVLGPRTGRSEPVRWGMEVAVGASAALLAHPVPHGSLGLSLSNRRFGLTLGAKALVPDRLSYGGGYVDIRLYAGFLSGYVAVAGRRESLLLELGGGPLFGALRGEGNAYDHVAVKQLSWLAASFGARLQASVAPPVGWYLSLLAVAPLARRSLSVLRDGALSEAFHTRHLGIMAEFGVTVEP